MASPGARLLPTAPREPRSRASRPAGYGSRSLPRDADFSSKKGDISEKIRPSRSPSPEEEIQDDTSELSEDFLRDVEVPLAACIHPQPQSARQLPTAAAYEADRRNKCCFCNFDYLNQASNRRNANPAFTGACILCPEHGQIYRHGSVMASPAARLLPTAPREPRSRASRPAGATRLLFDPRKQAEHKDTAPAASPRDADFSSERGDISERSRPSRSPSPEEEFEDDTSELSEDFLRRLCQGADLEDVEALEIRVDSTRQSLELLGQCFPNLKRLRLSESSILCVRELGSRLAKLQVLWLGRCGLQDLDGLTLLEGLRELYLPFNDVVDVALPKWLDHLQVLDLEGNAVEDPDDLAELTKCYALRDLTIRGNPVTFLPGFSRRTFFDQMPSLEFLDDLPNFPDLPLQADLPCEEPLDGDAERFLDRYLACDLDLYMDLYLQETPQVVEDRPPGFQGSAPTDAMDVINLEKAPAKRQRVEGGAIKPSPAAGKKQSTLFAAFRKPATPLSNSGQGPSPEDEELRDEWEPRLGESWKLGQFG
eukprot:s4055_g1.t2